MNRTSFIAVLGLALILGAAPLTAEASLIDFKDSSWSGAYGQHSFTLYLPGLGVDLTLTANGGRGLYWDAQDGIGILGGEGDEIDRGERLTVSFSQPLSLLDFTLTDLFNEHGYRERGSYRLDGGPAQNFIADPGQTLGNTNGILIVSTGGGQVSDLQLWALHPTPKGQHHDFSLGSLNTGSTSAATPEPASLALLGSALGLGAWRQRRRRHITRA